MVSPFSARGLLRGHVAGRADDGAGLRSARCRPRRRLARPKSVTCGCAVGVEQDVGRLQVAVQDAALVGVVDGPGDRRQQSAAAASGSRRQRRGMRPPRLPPSISFMLK